MIRNLLVVLVVVLFISCEKKSQTPQEMILGNWSVADTTTQPWGRKDIRGFKFSANGICDYKPGYWDWQKYDSERIRIYKSQRLADMDNLILPYLGTQTKYLIVKDSFKIFDLSEKKWDSYKIKKLNNDSLVLARDTIVTTFIKKHYDIDKSDDFDAVILSSSGCYGNCTSNEILINKNGDIVYKGNFHVVKQGWHTAKISPLEFDVIMNRFKEADYMNLKNDYSSMVTDSQNISVSFIKDGKVIKTIDDYADSAPNEFIWAYTPLIKFGQKLNLKSIAINKQLDKDFFYAYLMTIDRGRLLDLSASEVFYLITLLMDAKEVKISFEEKYILSYDNYYIKEIKTDGRYYKLYFKNGKTEIRDIGFNIITESNLKNKFEIIKNK